MNHQIASTETPTLASRLSMRARMARAPGILFLTAALLVPLSGVTALDVAAPADLPPLPPQGDTAATGAASSEASGAETVATMAPAPAAGAPLFDSGDRLDADDRAAFLAWAAAQKAAGTHKGLTIYSSW